MAEAPKNAPGTWLGLMGKLFLWLLGVVVAAVIGLVITDYHKVIYHYFFPPAEKLVARAEALNAMLSDLNKAPEDERDRRRYLSLAHLYVPGVTEEERTKTREAIREAVAFLSPKGRVATLEPLGPHNCVLRLNLDHFGWEGRDQWRTVLKSYPYALEPGKNADEAVAAAETKLRKAQPDLPYVRGDWFAARVTQPPLAEKLKIDRDVPEALRQFSHAYAERDIGARRLAAEMGAKIDDLRAKIQAEKRLHKKFGLGPLAEGGTVTRATLEDRRFGTSAYQELAGELNLGIPEFIN